MGKLMNVAVNPEFWRGKRVLLTGHTGFKGSWLSLWLQEMGALVRGVSLLPSTCPAMFNIAKVAEGLEHQITDIRDLSAIKQHISEFDPDILIHMAAQSLVLKSYQEPVQTFEVNIMGTVNVLDAAKSGKSLKAIINVTTDKCYDNKEWVWGYREEEPMGGLDPYSSSKGCVELISSAYRKSFLNDAGISMATARAGNVIGGGDWSEDRLLPDIFRSLEKGEPVAIRNPNAIRPWQHALEPLSGYLILAQCLYGENGPAFAEGWNFGPSEEDAKPVEWVVKQMCAMWSADASWTTQPRDHMHEANSLKLDISKAREKLKWTPTWDLQIALTKTIDWHRAWLDGQDMRSFSLAQIEIFNCAMRQPLMESSYLGN